MGFFKTSMKKGFGGGLNPKKWIGLDLLTGASKTLWHSAKYLFQRQDTAQQKETFTAAMERLQLSDADLKKRMRSAKQLIVIFLFFSVGLFAYGFYHFSKAHIIDGIICLTLTLLTLTYAFREHFYLFQMKQKKLGCSYQEWMTSLKPSKK